MTAQEDEFASLGEMADEFGLPRQVIPRGERRSIELPDGRSVSSLIWGTRPPELVFIHGGGQNAHTWDLVVALLGRPAIAVDLPGHGHSSWREDQDYRAPANAEAVAFALQRLAPDARTVIGMSLGGMTAIGLAAGWPELVPRLVLVDILPRAVSAARRLAAERRGPVALIDGPRVFASLDDMVAATIAASPGRPASAIRRGVINNAAERGDGTWRWRYDDLRVERDTDAAVADGLWADLESLRMPLMLALGGNSGFVTDEDAARFRAMHPDAPVVSIDNAGHSIQSDQPVALAAVISWFENRGAADVERWSTGTAG